MSYEIWLSLMLHLSWLMLTQHNIGLFATSHILEYVVVVDDVTQLRHTLFCSNDVS